MARIRIPVRQLWRSPGVVLAAIAICALATSLSASVVSVVDRIVLRPLPFHEPAELVQISSRSPSNTRSDALLPVLYGTAIREHAKAIAASSFALNGSTSLAIGNNAPATFYFAPHSLLRTLGVRVVAGRDFVEQDVNTPGRHVLISQDVWQNRFGGAHDVFDRRFDSEKVGDMFGRRLPEPLWIVGVLPPDFIPPSSAITERLDGLILTRDYRAPAGSLTTFAPALIARLRPGWTLEAAASELQSVARSVWNDRPDIQASSTPPELILVEPLRSGLFYKLAGFARLTLVAAALLVALGAVNLAILLVVHHRRHERDAAIQAALGASASTLVIAPLVEALLLSSAGCALGLGLAAGFTRLLTLGLPDHLRLLAVPITDVRVIAASVLIAAAAGLAAGIPAALYRRRAPMLNLVRSVARRRQVNTAWRPALLVVQMAVTTTLVGGAVVAGRNYLAAATAQGFEAEGLATLSSQYLIAVPPSQRVPQILRAVDALPDVAAAGVAVPNLILPSEEDDPFWTDRGFTGGTWGITARLFETTATPVRAGRAFSDQEVWSGSPVALLNEKGARLLFPSERLRDVVGRQIDTRHGQRVVVGIVQDIKPIGRTTATAGLFVPITDPLAKDVDKVTSLPVLVRTTSAAIDTERATKHLDTELGGGNVIAFPAAPRLHAVLQAPTVLLILLLSLGIGAVAISATVVFAMTSMTAEMRRHEVAVRVALGARLGHVVTLFAKGEGGITLLGLGLGIPMSIWLGRLLQTFVMEAAATDYLTYVVAGVLMIVTVFTAVSQSVVRFHRRVIRSIQRELGNAR